MKKLNQLTVFILFLFVALLVSCEKEQPNEKEPTKLTEETTIVEKVTIEQLKQETVKTTIFENISENLDISLDKFSKRGVEDRITILTDRILKVEKDSVITYSFMIEKPTSVSSDIENLMIFKYPNDTYRFLIVGYKYTGDEVNPLLVSTKEIKSDDLKKVRYSKFVARRPELPFRVDDCVRVLIKQCKDAFANGNKIHGSAVCGNPPGSGPGTIIILDFSGCIDGGGKFDINSPGLNPKNKWHINLTPTSSGRAKSYVSNSSIIDNKVVSGGAGAAVLCMDTPDGCIRQYDIEIEYLMDIKDTKTLNYLKENRGFAQRVLVFYEDNMTEEAKQFAVDVIRIRSNNNLTEEQKITEFNRAYDKFDPILPPTSQPIDYEAKIKQYAKEFRKRGKIEFANYLESLLPLNSNFDLKDYKSLYETIRKQKVSLFLEYLMAILNVTYDSFKPLIEMALWDVGGGLAVKILGKLPTRYLTTPIKNVIKRLKVPTSTAFSNLKHAKKYGIKSYKELGKTFKELGLSLNKKGVERHHLIEKRFVNQMKQKLGENTDDWLCIIVEKTNKATNSEHYRFTKAWREAIGINNKAGTTGYHTGNATYNVIIKTAKDIYKDYPEILKVLKL